MARRVTTPLRSLVLGTQRLSRGEYDVPVEHTDRNDEVGYLARSFDHMRIGIAEQHRERVFERFYRLDRTQRGTGLGLPIVQHAVHSLGGRLEIGDGLGGRGIAFSIVLPHHTPAAGA